MTVKNNLVGLAFLLLAGCSPNAGGGQSVDALVRCSDPELREAVIEILSDLTERSGLSLTSPVRVDRRSREELERYLRYKLDQELPPEEAALRTAAYHRLGLFPGDLDLRALLLSVYTEQVAGFYDPDSTALFVMDDQPTALLRPVLVHELVHAVQDQAADLDSIMARERGNDRQLAAQAAIEGHATVVMLEYLTEQMQRQPVDFSTLPNFAEQLRPALEGMGAQYPALAGAPRIIRESLVWPYLGGSSFLQALWAGERARPAPLGESLPQSTEQVLHPERFLGPERDDPTEIRIVPADGAEVRFSNTLGEVEMGILLDEHLGAGSFEMARGWDGDRFALVDGGGEEDGLVWVSVWDDASSRSGFVQALRPALGALPLPATLEEVEVEGRPGAMLTVGVVGEVRVTVLEGPAR